VENGLFYRGATYCIAHFAVVAIRRLRRGCFPCAKVVCFIKGFEGLAAASPQPELPEERLAVVASEAPILTGLAGRYATALYELAEEAKALDQVAADLAQLKAAITGNADLKRLIASPLVPREQQAKAVLALVAKMGLGDLTRRFVGTVARNRRLFRLPAVITPIWHCSPSTAARSRPRSPPPGRCRPRRPKP